MTDQKISLSIEVDDNGSIKVRQFSNNTVQATRDAVTKTDSLLKRIQTRMGQVIQAAGGIFSKLTSLKTMALGTLAGWGVKALAGSFLDVGSSVDQLKLSLDTATKGEGEEWFQRLNEWAMKMPVNTRSAINAFTQMRTMGLSPTIEQMTTLVDTTSALDGSKDTLMGISRALGQIATKGRVSTEELLQLAERGVPVFDILKEKMNLTQEQLGNIGNQGLDAQETIQALIEGMADRFGGQSEKMQGMWAGLWESAKAYFQEFQRMVMDSGVMDYLEGKLSDVIALVEQWYQDGTMLAFAQSFADGFTSMMDTAIQWIGDAWKVAVNWWEDVSWQIQYVLDDLKPLYTWLVKIINITQRVLNALAKVNVGGNMIEDFDSEDTTSSSVPQYANGTGLSGLPYTGLFYGHKGEIVKNPSESDAERRGTGSGVNVTIAPTFMTGDANAARSVARELQRLMTGQDRRWGAA
ncbi:hypothetical protein DSCO28_07320 [Desulfosarcina ovata subsp. sediminis]|uniref:Tape measure protein N-terminal domain-containing protein n=1 Tax=Desulfosarcina ovata subsp. sediminis TaxID=885957 RepID=A0A5K7ZGR0_9BACT|nr:tape measure protein [Desulfosarcina ovata]BBO80166.1 hypothetical protein DSCO28_07320 [Desulfosarcina ovata subsp. sediminis]